MSGSPGERKFDDGFVLIEKQQMDASLKLLSDGFEEKQYICLSVIWLKLICWPFLGTLAYINLKTKQRAIN